MKAQNYAYYVNAKGEKVQVLELSAPTPDKQERTFIREHPLVGRVYSERLRAWLDVSVLEGEDEREAVMRVYTENASQFPSQKVALKTAKTQKPVKGLRPEDLLPNKSSETA